MYRLDVYAIACGYAWARRVVGMQALLPWMGREQEVGAEGIDGGSTVRTELDRQLDAAMIDGGREDVPHAVECGVARRWVHHMLFKLDMVVLRGWSPGRVGTLVRT